MSTTDMLSNINNTNFVDKSYSWYIAPMVLQISNIAHVTQGLSTFGRGAGVRPGEWKLRMVENSDVGDSCWVGLDGLKEIQVELNQRTERHLLRPYDVLVTARGDCVGAALVPWDVERMVASVTLLVVRTHRPEFGMGHYLWYFLTSSQGQAQLQRQLTVSPSVTSLSASNLSEVKLSVPSEQKLSQIAKLVEASENAYAATLKAARIGRAAIRDSIIGEVQSDPLDLYTDADLRGKWVLKGEPALVDSTSPRWGEKASYYSAVCLETGEVELMELEGNSNAETSTAFLKQLREKHTGRLIVLWDNAPAHRGDAMRAYLATPELGLRLVNLPGYSPDFNADEAIWDWAREEVTANLCLGTKAAVQEKLGHFFAQLAYRTDEVKQRCRTALQARVEALPRSTLASSYHAFHVDPT